MNPLQMRLNSENYKEIFYNSPVAKLILSTDSPNYTVLDANDAYISATNSSREVLVGKSVFEVFPSNPLDQVSQNVERTIESFEAAIHTGHPHIMSNYRYDIPVAGTDKFEERYWTTANIPVVENGIARYIIHCPTNVTEIIKLKESEKSSLDALKAQREQLFSTFMQAPVGIGIFKGPDYVVELINPPLCELYGKTIEELVGRPIFSVLVHTKGKGFEQLLDQVRETGIPYKADNVKIILQRNGVVGDVYVNFVYEPFYENDGTRSGVIVIASEVTGQVTAIRLVAEAEERARLAVDAAEMGTFDLNLETGQMITSEQYAHIFGFSHPVSADEYLKAFHPDDLEIRASAHHQVLETGKLEYEARIVWEDHSVHWVKIEGKLFNGSKNGRVLGIVLDITAQRNAQLNQQKLMSLVNNSVDLMSILDMNGKNSYINEAGKKLLGFDSEHSVNDVPISELHDPQDFLKVQQEVLPGVLEKGQWSGIMKVRHLKSGEIFPVYNNTVRIDNPLSGKPIAIGAVMRDLRPELEAKQALANSEELLRAITSAAPTSLWMSDENGAVSYVNQTWTEWTGLSYEESLGDGWVQAILPEDRQMMVDVFRSSRQKRDVLQLEFRMICKQDDSVHWYISSGNPQFSNGNLSGYIGAFIDITDQKQVQIQKDNFIAIASHELKTPVTSIKAYVQVLQMMLADHGNHKEATMVTKMATQVDRLIALINELLDVTKINSGKLQFENVHFDFNQMVKDLIEDLQRTYDNHRIIEQFENTGMVFGDRERIGQVVTNFITNAIKYSPNASSIIVTTCVQNNEVVLCVKDFGIGIAEDNLPKVFEQFYRVSGDIQHTFPGLGLGLYISSEIIKRENGRIFVKSKPGIGSEFGFALPLAGNTN
jgi:PAS domain S-box-containing protein